MNLRHLVPVMGVLAITAGSSVFAEDKGPSVTINGWSDNFLYVESTNGDNDPATAKNEKSTGIGFYSQESVKVNAKILDNLTAKINVFINPGNVVNTNTPLGGSGAGVGVSNINVREGYLSWAINADWTWTAGKFIDHIGWLSPEPTGLYTPNATLIGYEGIYGNDVIGTNIAYASKDVPVSGSLHITNGYFDAADVNSQGAPGPGRSATRENADLGYGLDLTYNLPKDLGNIDFDFAYDPHGGDPTAYSLGAAPTATPGDGLGGDALLLGLNATVKPVEGWMIGAEIMYFTIGDVKDATKTKLPDTGIKRTQGLLLVNYALPKNTVSIPVSVSLMGQYITAKSDADGSPKPKATEIAVAVLTNPLQSANFGINGELAFTSFDADVDGTKKLNDVTFSVEALVAF